MNWQQLFQQFGFPLVALGIGLESMGIPAPGETILLVAAAAAAAGNGNIVWVIVAAAAGAIIGDNVAFTLGRRYGRSLIARIPFVDDQKLSHSEAFFVKHGSKTVIIARFIPVVRSVVAYIAGINQMDHWTFTAYNLFGGILWATTIGTLGFVFGKNLHLLELWLRRAGGVWVAILLVGGLLLWGNHRWHLSEHAFRLSRTGSIFSAWHRLLKHQRQRLLVNLILLLVSGWIAGVLIDDWVEKEPELYERDILVTAWLHIGAEEVSPWVELLAWLGDIRFLTAVSLATAGWLWFKGRRRFSLLTLFNIAGALALGLGLQYLFKRPLPIFAEPQWRISAYAFPHLPSLVAVATYGWLALFWRSRSWKAWLNSATLASFLSLTVAIIGLYLGQGKATDVLAGLALGFLWLGILATLTDETAVNTVHQVRSRANDLLPRQRLHLLLALTVPVLILTFIEPPLAQDPSYHHFADQRTFLGIPNFWNVISNIPFLLFGVMGLALLAYFFRRGGLPAFSTLAEQRPYLIFFVGVAITSVGSAYYHLAPDNTHLVWDRLPMTLGFMSIFAAVIAERIDRNAGLRLLWPMIFVGVASVIYWYWSELHLRGDLRFYVDVQFYPLLAIPLLIYLFPSRYTRGEQIFTIILIYALAKALELLDKEVFHLLGNVISGHSLKHVVAALATLATMRMLWQRQPLAAENDTPGNTGA
ncbi:MAG: VTT domain-containing protein [Ardenticatenales bacterium]|nr:VTT domain-containing protein [Ardenticatenales bacterium]